MTGINSNTSHENNPFIKGRVILIDKPVHWTSFDVLNKMRGLIKHFYKLDRKVKVGHAGTLDPLATGLLITCTGRATKQIQYFQGMEKEYTGTFVLGATTPSFDLESEPEQHYSTDHITESSVINAAKSLTGVIMQRPPAFSAVKLRGKKAYQLARKGIKPKLAPKQVEVHSFQIEKTDLPVVHFRIVCSKGTYIRALARDLGEKLQCGAYLGSLRRTRIGEHTVKEAFSLDEFKHELQHE